jgi:hypothetical protein
MQFGWYPGNKPGHGSAIAAGESGRRGGFARLGISSLPPPKPAGTTRHASSTQ